MTTTPNNAQDNDKNQITRKKTVIVVKKTTNQKKKASSLTGKNHHPITGFKGAVKNAIPVREHKPTTISTTNADAAASRTTTASVAGTKGLPLFHPRIPVAALIKQQEEDDKERQQRAENDLLILGSLQDDDIPCDALLAIQSLQASSQGLHLPLLWNDRNNQMIQVVLESQVFQRFHNQDSNNNTTTIWRELLELVQDKVLLTLPVKQGTLSTTTSPIVAYIFTKDYVRGVWDAHYHHEQSARRRRQLRQNHQQDDNYCWDAVISWFLTTLLSKHNKWCTSSSSSITKESMKQQWKTFPSFLSKSKTKNNNANNHPNDHADNKPSSAKPKVLPLPVIPPSLGDAIQYLLQIQVLLRETLSIHQHSHSYQEESYGLWLPQWGVTLKAWNEARQQLLNYVGRFKEVSERNVLRENRHANLSTKFVWDELIFQGKLRIIQRPFGRFVKRV